MDINELKARLQALNKGGSKQKDIWKPKDEHDVRLVPYPHGSDPFIELHFHYEVGDNPPILCPKLNYGEDCEICDFAETLKAWKTPDGDDKDETTRKADWEIFKKIQAKARVFIPMVERGKEGELAKFWGVTPNQAAEILEVCADGDRLEMAGVDAGDTKNALKVLFDPNKGFDLHVSFAKVGEKGNTKTFAQTKITGKVKPGPISKDKKQQEEILASVKKINEVYPKVASSEVKRLLEKFVGGAAPEAKADGGAEKYAGKKEEKKASPKANTNENAEKVGGRSIDEAFGEMLGEDSK